MNLAEINSRKQQIKFISKFLYICRTQNISDDKFKKS